MEKKKIIIAITGATGMLYVEAILKLLANRKDIQMDGIISPAGVKVMALELNKKPQELGGINNWFAADDFTAPVASGSSLYHSMIILPCTTGTMGAIANGYSGNLIHRAADVMLKEKRPLVLCVRETPLNMVHLQNMLTLAQAGAIICPPMPSFYLRPESLKEMATNFGTRVCDQVGIEIETPRWRGMN